VVFEGRWWYTQCAANGTNTANKSSYALCVIIGEHDEFTIEAQTGLRTAWDWGRSQGGAGGKDWVHRDWFPTACAGPDITGFVRAGLPAEGIAFAPAPSRPATPITDWEVQAIMALEQIDLSHASNSNPVSTPHTDNMQGLLLAADAPNAAALVRPGTAYPDGVAGQGTKDMLIWFQKSKGLAADGICGPRTWTALIGA
jgi:peptidoglycan hydrolase-like protein with peptidoglycan-binding domain